LYKSQQNSVLSEHVLKIKSACHMVRDVNQYCGTPCIFNKL